MKAMCMFPLFLGLVFGGRSESVGPPDDYFLRRHEMVERQIESARVRLDALKSNPDLTPNPVPSGG